MSTSTFLTGAVFEWLPQATNTLSFKSINYNFMIMYLFAKRCNYALI